MELKEFVKSILIQLNDAVDEARDVTSRDIHFSGSQNNRTVEFDIAISAEDIGKKEGKTGVKVLQFAEAGGTISKENKNSTISRVTFGLQIDYSTKQENRATEADTIRHNNQLTY